MAPRILHQRKVAIVGLGGTGGYVLDQVAKTPVLEIHLFDGDRFKRHNAFRAPGAATRNHLRSKWNKVDYFVQMDDPMRKGIVPHPYFITAENVAELAGFDFVFVCVDDGGARRIICEFLTRACVPFGRSPELCGFSWSFPFPKDNESAPGCVAVDWPVSLRWHGPNPRT
jgi:tRNA A37 threonylcarbamoyladenosine dehydratase